MKESIDGPAVCVDDSMNKVGEIKPATAETGEQVKPFDWSRDKDAIADNAREKLRAELRGMTDSQISERNKRRAEIDADLEEVDRKMAERMRREEDQRLKDAKPLNRISNFFKRVFKR